MPEALISLFKFSSIAYRVLVFVLSFWWLLPPFILFIFAWHLWVKYKREGSVRSFKWVLLEIKPPREIVKTPLAMEQVFAGLHGCFRAPNWKEINIEGYTQNWFSFEMVSLGGEIHFFIRTLEMFRNLVEANIYAQYPEAEISQVNDYVDNVPSYTPEGDFDIWGTELQLVKEDAYPIRTYADFGKGITLEEQRVDPVALLLEVMAKVSRSEQIWIQMLMRPAGSAWMETGEKLRNKLIERKEPSKGSALGKEIGAWIHELSSAAGVLLGGEELAAQEAKEDDSKQSALWWMTKGEGDVVKAIEENISKFGFETIIRFVYAGKKDIFSKANVSAVIGAFKQFGSQNLNGLKPNGNVTTSAVDYKWQGSVPREIYRKKRVLADYKKRYFTQHSETISYLNSFIFERLPVLRWFFIRSKPFVFNIEELATVYHFPSQVVKAPLTPKVEAKKSEPPMALPTE